MAKLEGDFKLSPEEDSDSEGTKVHPLHFKSRKNLYFTLYLLSQKYCI